MTNRKDAAGSGDDRLDENAIKTVAEEKSGGDVVVEGCQPARISGPSDLGSGGHTLVLKK